MGLNLDALKKFDKELDERGGGKTFLYQKNLTEEGIDFRIAEPLAALEGNYFVEVIKWWINGKSYISPETFGKDCPIQAEVDAQANTRDKEIKLLLADEDKIKKVSEFWIPGFQLKAKDEKATDYIIVDNCCKVLSTTMMLMKEINGIVTGRIASRIDSDNGITDYVLGRNILASKKGAGRNGTKYKAELGDEWEVPEAFRNTAEHPVVNVMKMAKDNLWPNKNLESVINNYLFGDPIIEFERKDSEKEEKEEKPATRSRNSEEEKPAERAASRKETKAEPERKAASTAGGRRSLLDDLENV